MSLIQTVLHYSLHGNETRTYQCALSYLILNDECSDHCHYLGDHGLEYGLQHGMKKKQVHASYSPHQRHEYFLLSHRPQRTPPWLWETLVGRRICLIQTAIQMQILTRQATIYSLDFVPSMQSSCVYSLCWLPLQGAYWLGLLMQWLYQLGSMLAFGHQRMIGVSNVGKCLVGSTDCHVSTFHPFLPGLGCSLLVPSSTLVPSQPCSLITRSSCHWGMSPNCSDVILYLPIDSVRKSTVLYV